MANKQARKRKLPVAKKRAVIKLPQREVRRTLAFIAASAAVAAVLAVAHRLLDVPVEGLTIDAPFQRVSVLQLREAIEPHARDGFLDMDLQRLREDVEALAWVDRASVRRVWPNALHVTVSEQVPAARWGESGLLNTRGELFVEQARHELAELPRLSGPEARVADVARQYLELRGPLIEAGLGLRAVTLDERGAWQFVLGSGIEVRLGRNDAAERAQRFVGVAAPVVARHEARIRYVDMRYSNGFAIGWKRDEFRQQARIEAAAANAASHQGAEQ